jgi:hypothetical protein
MPAHPSVVPGDRNPHHLECVARTHKERSGKRIHIIIAKCLAGEDDPVCEGTVYVEQSNWQRIRACRSCVQRLKEALPALNPMPTSPMPAKARTQAQIADAERKRREREERRDEDDRMAEYQARKIGPQAEEELWAERRKSIPTLCSDPTCTSCRDAGNPKTRNRRFAEFERAFWHLLSEYP